MYAAHVSTPFLIVRQRQSTGRTLFNTQPARYAFEWHRLIIMITNKTSKAFGYANKAANASIFGNANNAVIGLFYCHWRTHFCANAALVANLDFIFAAVFNNADGTLFLVGCFEIGFGANFFTSTAAGTFVSICYQFFHNTLLVLLACRRL
jgi:hypothetical protein